MKEIGLKLLVLVLTLIAIPSCSDDKSNTRLPPLEKRPDLWLDSFSTNNDTVVTKIGRTQEWLITQSTTHEILDRTTEIRVGTTVADIPIGAIRCTFHWKDAGRGVRQYMWRGRWSCMAGRNVNEIENAIAEDGTKRFAYINASPVTLTSAQSGVPSLSELPEIPTSIALTESLKLTEEELRIYRYAAFETISFTLYSYGGSDYHALNAFSACIRSTKDNPTWNDGAWTWGEHLDRSLAWGIYNTRSPLLCDDFNKSAGEDQSTPDILRLFELTDWTRWTLRERGIYVVGYLDTQVALAERLRDAGGEDEVDLLKRVIDQAKPHGILREVMLLEFQPQYPLPWTVSRGLGAAREHMEKVRS